MENKLILPVIITAADALARSGNPLPIGMEWQINAAVKEQNYYERVLMRTVRDRYEGRADDFGFLLLFTAFMTDQLRRAWLDGMQAVGVDSMDSGMESELFVFQAREETHIRPLLDDIKAAIAAGAGWQMFRSRIDLWSNRWLDVSNRAMVVAGTRVGRNLEWVLGPTEQHCTDCGGYAGQVKTAQAWDDIYRVYGHRPQAYELACHGFNCQCMMRMVK